MQDDDLFPPLLDKRPFTELEINMIKDELRALTEDIFIKVITGLGIVILIAILPRRRMHHESLVSKYGFRKGLAIAFATVAILSLWSSRPTQSICSTLTGIFEE